MSPKGPVPKRPTFLGHEKKDYFFSKFQKYVKAADENVGLFGTGPFGDSLLGPLGTLYWALSGQFTGPFGDSFSISGQQVGLSGTLYWALSGQF